MQIYADQFQPTVNISAKIYKIDDEVVTEKQFYDTKYASAFLELNAKTFEVVEPTVIQEESKKYRVGRKLGNVILTVNGETEIGRVHDKEMALRVCEFLNDQYSNNDNAIEVIKNRIAELEGMSDVYEQYNCYERIEELNDLLKLLTHE